MNKKNELDTIFSSLNGSKHVLHLYTQKVNKYAIHRSFLLEGNGKSAYVTSEDPKEVRKQVPKTKFKIIHPKDMDKLLEYDTIVIDGASITPETIEEVKKLGKKEAMKHLDHFKREKYLKENTNGQSFLCTYDITKLDPKKLRELVEQHDKFILSSDSTTVMSSNAIPSKKFINNKTVDAFVKKELKTIVLALLMGNPMCGTDIKKKIFEKFNMLLSSGTLYPLLHELEEKKLLECRYGVKTKTYAPIDENEIQKILNEHIEVKNFLNDFLQTAMQKKVKGEA